ncbi:origin of replication complex subunit 6-like isoform X3 [Hibiscus syriacus]|uniref:origin of replication complex subunit 6-like isoform X3 n=1 Tax=Hibiscus syriacus TaxID=106335 RepID=UPI001923CA2F|nr:origin of replication complex subunit 6-like isoform X3 [Hibiscus syriacus]
MDLSDIARKLDLSQHKMLVRKAAELRRLCDVQFDSSIIGVGEVCKAVICLEIAATRFGEVLFDRQKAVKLSGMSEKAYNRSFNSLQNGLNIKTTLDIRELGIQFGCVRLIPFVKKGLSLQASADFTRPVFTAVAFYLCAKKHKLKIDKDRLIEVCGTSESEFSCVSTSMKDLCHDVFGISNEKKDPKGVKGNRELLDVLPEKRKFDDGGYLSDDEPEISSYKRKKKAEKVAYEEWKSTVLSSNKKSTKAPCKRTTQTSLNFLKEVFETKELKAV